MSYLSDFEEINGRYVAFGGNPKGGKITGKGKIRTGKLDFDDVYFVKELKFNLFSVSQMCDKKNIVLFTDTEYIVLSPEFKLPDENQVLLKVTWENNMYNVDLKNIILSGDLTCLFAKNCPILPHGFNTRLLEVYESVGVKRSTPKGLSDLSTPHEDFVSLTFWGSEKIADEQGRWKNQHLGRIGHDPLEFITWRNSKFKDHKKVNETTKCALLRSWIEVRNNEGIMDEDISSDDDRDHTNSSMITKPKLNIGNEFLQILHDNSFNGMDRSNVIDHIAKVLKITEYIKILIVDKNELRLYVFSKSLSGDAKKWWNSEVGLDLSKLAIFLNWMKKTYTKGTLRPFQLRMKTLSLLLSGEARKWRMNKEDGKINTWEELVKKFF
nr:ribonuclease H-like domain-containing protein [Tanacetum cinerariifolium]